MRRLLIVGCGDIGLRVVALLRRRYRLYALSHSIERYRLLRRYGIVPLPGDLDDPASLQRLRGIAHDVLHFAPPSPAGLQDTRTAHLIRALRRGESIPQRFLYISTSGVYGDCGGDVVFEHRRTHPKTARAGRRLDAERRVRAFGRDSGLTVTILRVPGIYSEARLPLERLRSGTPVLIDADDAYSNHVHAEDLARMVLAALARGRNGRIYNASDGHWMKMGQWFDLVAEEFDLPRPPRIPRAEAEQRLPATLLSFMDESRRLSNLRVREELRVRLRYPSPQTAIEIAARAARASGAHPTTS